MDNKPTDTPNSQPRQVMDIQPPQPSGSAPFQPSPAPVQNSGPVDPAPVPTEPVAAPAANEAVHDNHVDAQPAPLAAQPPAHKHSRLPLLAIIVAVGLAGVLGTFAVIAYKDSSKNPATTTSQTAPVAKETVAPAAVDETNAAVDSSLNSVDDNAEYNDSSLSDTTLGL